MLYEKLCEWTLHRTDVFLISKLHDCWDVMACVWEKSERGTACVQTDSYSKVPYSFGTNTKPINCSCKLGRVKRQTSSARTIAFKVHCYLPRPATQWTAMQLSGLCLRWSFSNLSQSSTTFRGGASPSSNAQSCDKILTFRVVVLFLSPPIAKISATMFGGLFAIQALIKRIFRIYR